MAKKAEQIVEEIVLPVIESMGLEYVGVEIVRQAKRQPELTVYIDKPGGVGLDDCERVSREIDPMIEDADPIADSYMLCVSSPGIDRPLKTERDFKRSVGKTVEVKLYKAFEGKKEFVGILTRYDSEGFTIQTDEETEMTFTNKETALVRLYVEF